MLAKAFILFAALAAAHASLLSLGHGGIINTGVSSRSQVQDGHGNYAFGYGIKNGHGAANSRSEVGDGHGNVKGSYALADVDGRARRVEYVADGHGFRAVVKTNEPGTAASAPAAALIASPYAAPVGPIDVRHAGIAGHGGLIGLGGINGLGLGLAGHGLALNGHGLGLNGLGLGLGGLGLGHGLGNGLLLH
ncbi:hypothetical protein JTE90_014372 [Oedothorax gibbosus]|uniref:Adult-specific rigid cuticular protein 15.7 n=1 Tax=Oedothorax gibbosus TaxID=931172 RepID=A0AAV6UE30_9ARAC|nr:hypothetical protein JTE90_014372 [Oedothorax gibbosus]